MHFQKKKLDSDGDYLPEPPALQGYEQTGVPFKQGWARKPKRQRGVPCRPEVKNFLRDCFLAAYDKFGKIYRARIITKSKAHVLLKAKMETEGWGADCYRSVQQIGGHYSQFCHFSRCTYRARSAPPCRPTYLVPFEYLGKNNNFANKKP